MRNPAENMCFPCFVSFSCTADELAVDASENGRWAMNFPCFVSFNCNSCFQFNHFLITSPCFWTKMMYWVCQSIYTHILVSDIILEMKCIGGMRSIDV